jgi:hypothetical protein
MPLIAWLEDQVASIAENNLSTKISANPPFNYKTVFIFVPMPIQRRRERPRFHRMFHERKAAARVIPINHKSDPSGTKVAGFTVLRLHNSRSVLSLSVGENSRCVACYDRFREICLS